MNQTSAGNANNAVQINQRLLVIIRIKILSLQQTISAFDFSKLKLNAITKLFTEYRQTWLQ